MPQISRFFGIVITMYYDDHEQPHFHASYAQGEASIAIEAAETGAQMGCATPARATISSMPEIVHPIAVEVVGGHRLRLRFDDGSEGEVDFSRRPWRGVFAPLQDPLYFAKVRLDPTLKTIAWPNGADVAPETLHHWVVDGDNPYAS